MAANRDKKPQVQTAILVDIERSIEEQLKDGSAMVVKVDSAENRAYTERNRLVAYLTKLFPSAIRRHSPDPDPNWDPRWLNVVVILLPSGQASWHVPDWDLHLFAQLEAHEGDSAFDWDGHTTEEKYDRMAGESPMCFGTGQTDGLPVDEWKALLGHRWGYDRYLPMVHALDSQGRLEARVCDIEVRGWGYLTSGGLTPDQAYQSQKEVAAHIVTLHNDWLESQKKT